MSNKLMTEIKYNTKNLSKMGQKEEKWAGAKNNQDTKETKHKTEEQI